MVYLPFLDVNSFFGLKFGFPVLRYPPAILLCGKSERPLLDFSVSSEF